MKSAAPSFTAMSENKRGGPGRGQGRKPVKQGEETVTLSLRVTVAQREKLARLGGAEWVRGKIDRAKEPNNGYPTIAPINSALCMAIGTALYSAPPAPSVPDVLPATNPSQISSFTEPVEWLPGGFRIEHFAKDDLSLTDEANAERRFFVKRIDPPYHKDGVWFGATAEEAVAWLEKNTGETWSLARIVETGIWPWFRFDYSPEHAHMFGDRFEGYAAQMIYGGDKQRLVENASDQDFLVTMFYVPAGILSPKEELVRTTPMFLPMSALRFAREDIQRLASVLQRADDKTVEQPKPEWHAKAWEIGKQSTPPASGKGGE